LERQVILFGQQTTDLAAVGGNDHRLAPGKVMSGSDVAGAPALLQELFNHPERDPKTMGNLDPGAFVLIIGIDNPLPEIQRERAHTQKLSPPAHIGYTIY